MTKLDVSTVDRGRPIPVIPADELDLIGGLLLEASASLASLINQLLAVDGELKRLQRESEIDPLLGV